MSVLSSMIPMLQADASFQGIMYSITLADKTIDTNNYEAFSFVNPSASKVAIQFNNIYSASNQPLSIDIIKESTAFAATGFLTPQNNDVGTSENSVLLTVPTAENVSTDPVTAGTTLYSYRNETAFNLNVCGVITIQPGYNVVFKFQNGATSTAVSTFNCSWWEVALS